MGNRWKIIVKFEIPKVECGRSKRQKEFVVRRLAVGPTGHVKNPPGNRTRNLLICYFASSIWIGFWLYYHHAIWRILRIFVVDTSISQDHSPFKKEFSCSQELNTTRIASLIIFNSWRLLQLLLSLFYCWTIALLDIPPRIYSFVPFFFSDALGLSRFVRRSKGSIILLYFILFYCISSCPCGPW